MSELTPIQKQKVTKMISDMRFVGMFTIIYGGLACLSIIGAVFGVPMIIAGLRLRESADYFATYEYQKDENALLTGFDKQGSFFNISKIIIIVSLVIMVLYIIILLMTGIAGIASLSQFN